MSAGSRYARPEVGPDDVTRSEAGFGLTEVIVALLILAVGMLAVAGIAANVGTVTQAGTVRTEQSMAGTQVLGVIRDEGYDAATDGSTVVGIGERDYTVEWTVTQVAPRVKEVEAVVSGMGPVGPDTMLDLLYAPRAYPTSP